MEVATIVREAGVEIGMDPELPLLSEVIERLEKEFIVHDWQVAKLDSAQWQALGAPMGLAVAIQALVEEEQHIDMMPKTKKMPNYGHQQQQHKEPERFSSGLTSRASVAIQDSDQLSSSARSNGSAKAGIRKITRKPMVKPSLFNRHAPLQVMEGKNPIDGTVEETTAEFNDDSEIMRVASQAQEESGEQQKPVQEKSKGSTCSLRKGCCGDEVATCFRTMMKTNLKVENTSSFCMSKLFDQALLHAKTGADLKAHTMFVIELSVVASALFLGAAIELWGAFPLDAVSENVSIDGGVPQALAFAFNLTSALLIISQLLCASAWIWSLRVISAVAPNKFHQYVVETRHFSDYINIVSISGFGFFCLDLFLLLAGMSLATTDNWYINGAALGVAMLVFIAGCIGMTRITSFQGRVAYHGMLMTTQDPNPAALAASSDVSYFKEREGLLHRAFERNSILDENRALDAYSKTCNPEFCALMYN